VNQPFLVSAEPYGVMLENLKLKPPMFVPVLRTGT